MGANSIILFSLLLAWGFKTNLQFTIELIQSNKKVRMSLTEIEVEYKYVVLDYDEKVGYTFIIYFRIYYVYTKLVLRNMYHMKPTLRRFFYQLLTF